MSYYYLSAQIIGKSLYVNTNEGSYSLWVNNCPIYRAVAAAHTDTLNQGNCLVIEPN